MKNKLTEIVTEDDVSLERIMGRAIELQSKAKDPSRITRKTCYQIASEVGVEKKYVERAIREEKEENVSDNYYLELARILNLRDKDEDMGNKQTRIGHALVKILKKAKRFRPKVYTAKEIKDALKSRDVNLSFSRVGEIIRNDGYSFDEVHDNSGNKKYKLRANYLCYY